MIPNLYLVIGNINYIQHILKYIHTFKYIIYYK